MYTQNLRDLRRVYIVNGNLIYSCQDNRFADHACALSCQFRLVCMHITYINEPFYV